MKRTQSRLDGSIDQMLKGLPPALRSVAAPYLKRQAHRRTQRLLHRFGAVGRAISMAVAVIIPAAITLLSQRKAKAESTPSDSSMPSSGYPQGM
ncbi:MAG: hypothetical protein SF162_13655 [bacterium]|nr:hypothetical protein [bacterium]